MSNVVDRNSVFISYSHRDRIWLDELRPHLGSLARERGFPTLFWDDTMIKTGSDWRAGIESALKSTKVAILLISKYFLVSEFITTNELPILLKAAENENALIIPIILSPCRYATHPQLQKFQAVNYMSKPVEGMDKVEYESIFLKVTELVDEALGKSTQQFSGSMDSTPKLSPQRPSNKTENKENGVIQEDGYLAQNRSPIKADVDWTRVVVQALPDGSLQYQTVLNNIRHESILTFTSRLLVDKLSKKFLGMSTFDPEISVALFELLIPNDFKPILFQSTGTVLILDSTTAEYPWELLQDTNDADLLPFSLRNPIIRQTVSESFTPRPSIESHDALVIGDPNTEGFLNQIPGARNEAMQITKLLGESGFIVNSRIRASAISCIGALYSQPYQLLHMSGHGAYEYELPDERGSTTGFVFGRDTIFTGALVGQMKVAPEIVFLNASYLGRHISAVNDSKTKTSIRYATSLPNQFMAIGSRAIIAPAGSVSDSAAETFAVTFYKELFAGNNLGQAILTARQVTHRQHNDNNTWGMYLCYGDPEYRLSGGKLSQAR